MTGEPPHEPAVSGRGHLPRLVPRALAPEGTLAGDYLRGRGGAPGLFPAPATGGEDRPGADGGAREDGGQADGLRLDPADLGVSSPEARRRVERIAAGEGVFVATGQQPLLFLGPLFVVYKALTAVEQARRLSASGTPALALFWVAGDDHDWDEVGRCRVLDPDNDLRTLRLTPPPGRRGRSVGPSELSDGVVELVGEMGELLPESEFVGDYLELLRDTWRPGRPVGEAFASSLRGLLKGEPFAWVDASSRAVRRASAPLIRRVLEDPAPVLDRLEGGAERCRDAGYPPQMPPRPGGLPVFVDTGSARRRLYRRGRDTLSAGPDGEELTRGRVLRELDDDPDAFSPSGELRPVLESWLLPVHAAVLGPSEIAYWAQLPPLFGWAGTEAPRVAPRRSWTVIEGKVEKVLQKLDAAPRAFRDGGRELADRVTDEGRPPAVETALREARRAVEGALDGVEEAVAEELPGIRSAVGAARHEAFEALARLEDAVDDRVRERHDVLLRQIRKAAAHLYPGGEPQERVLSPFYYLARYGDVFLEQLSRAGRELAEAEAGDAVPADR